MRKDRKQSTATPQPSSAAGVDRSEMCSCRVQLCALVPAAEAIEREGGAAGVFAGNLARRFGTSRRTPTACHCTRSPAETRCRKRRGCTEIYGVDLLIPSRRGRTESSSPSVEPSVPLSAVSSGLTAATGFRPVSPSIDPQRLAMALRPTLLRLAEHARQPLIQFPNRKAQREPSVSSSPSPRDPCAGDYARIALPNARWGQRMLQWGGPSAYEGSAPSESRTAGVRTDVCPHPKSADQPLAVTVRDRIRPDEARLSTRNG